MKARYLFLLTIAIVIATTGAVLAQGNPPPLPFAPTQAPIDGGLSILAAAGGAYAVKKLRDKRRGDIGE